MKTMLQFWVFRSSSGKKFYQTIEWRDDTALAVRGGERVSHSCDCPGWTQRNPPGGRTCKHVRIVLCGMADQTAVSWGEPEARWVERKAERRATAKDVPKQPAKVTPGRAFDFD